MKTFKNKTRILTYLICFSVLSLTSISCETNDDLESFIETSEKEKAAAKTMAKANIKTGRTRMKQRRNGLYRASIIVNNDNEDQVSTVAYEIQAKEGFIKERKIYFLDYYKTIKGKKYYSFGDIKFENKDIVNQEVTVNITLLDAKKEVISKTTKVITIQASSKANIKRTRLKKRSNGMYKLTVELDDPENEVASIDIKVDELNGLSTSFNAKQKKGYITKQFRFNETSESEKVNVIYTFLDGHGFDDDFVRTISVDIRY